MTVSPFDLQPFHGRALVVEDASVFREVQSLLLRRAGYEVVTCEEPVTALEHLAFGRFDIVIVNSDRPGVDTPEFLLTIRRQHPAISVIIIARAMTLDFTRRVAGMGAVAVFQRPVEPHTLAGKLDQIMGYTVRPGASRFHGRGPEPAGSLAATVVRDAACR